VRPIRSLIRKSMFAFRESIWGPIFFQEFSPFTPVAKQMGRDTTPLSSLNPNSLDNVQSS
jgi:hypothetical protein